MRMLLVGGLLAALTCPGGTQAADSKSSSCDDLVGVWEYLEPTPPGRAVIAKLGTKYVGAFISTRKGPVSVHSELTTDAEKAAAYSATSAAAWEYTCEGSGGRLRMKNHTLFSLKPNEVGSEATVELELQGDSAKWWFLGPDGKRGTINAGRRLR